MGFSGFSNDRRRRSGTYNPGEPSLAPGKRTLVEQHYTPLAVDQRIGARAPSASVPEPVPTAQNTSGSCDDGDTQPMAPPRVDESPTREATRIGTEDTHTPEWKLHGEFRWQISWLTDGRRGWIVQEIANTFSGTYNKFGDQITNDTTMTTPRFFEAWEVNEHGKITGSLGRTRNEDTWGRARMPYGSKGAWSITGTVYWTPVDPVLSGFSSGEVRDSGTLLSSTSAPAKLSRPLHTRSARGVWDSSHPKPTHAGEVR